MIMLQRSLQYPCTPCHLANNAQVGVLPSRAPRHTVLEPCRAIAETRGQEALAPSQQEQWQTTVWDDTKDASLGFPSLQQNLVADVVVVGAGIAGLTTAYNLLKAGKSVVVLESGKVSGGQSGRSTAQLMTWDDDYFSKVMDQFGRRRTRLLAKAHRDAIATISQICSDEKIECGFARVNGYLFPHATTPEAFQKLDLELLAAKDAKVPGVERVNLGGVAAAGGIKIAVQFPGSADINPVQYVQGLAKAVAARGGRIFEHSRVKVTGDNKCIVSTENGCRVTAQNIVLASNSPLHHNLAIHSRQTAYRLYVSALKMKEGSYKEGQYWSTDNPSHFIRLVKGTSQGDVLLIRGRDHPCGEGPAGTPPQPWVDLEDFVRQRWTGVGEVVHRWSGQVYQPIDSLGLFGQDPFNDFQTRGRIFTATGDSGQGMTGGTTAGQCIAAAILNQRDPYKDIFSPSRLPSPLGDTGSNLAGVLTHVSKGYVGAALPNPNTAADMPRASGAVITEGTRKVAAYKDKNGAVHRKSAICPHMLCACEWNPTAETFECPCHGSYFDKFGKLLQGPGKSDLPPLP